MELSICLVKPQGVRFTLRASSPDLHTISKMPLKVLVAILVLIAIGNLLPEMLEKKND